METKRVVTEEDMKRFRKFEDCLKWLGENHKYGTCPKCGQELVDGTGPHGVFKICSNPECDWGKNDK